jgi:hypothetical protein
MGDLRCFLRFPAFAAAFTLDGILHPIWILNLGTADWPVSHGALPPLARESGFQARSAIDMESCGAEARWLFEQSCEEEEEEEHLLLTVYFIELPNCGGGFGPPLWILLLQAPFCRRTV